MGRGAEERRGRGEVQFSSAPLPPCSSAETKLRMMLLLLWSFGHAEPISDTVFEKSFDSIKLLLRF
jgi:hypothetical protein